MPPEGTYYMFSAKVDRNRGDYSQGTLRYTELICIIAYIIH